jgi:hypothetical protein
MLAVFRLAVVWPRVAAPLLLPRCRDKQKKNSATNLKFNLFIVATPSTLP